MSPRSPSRIWIDLANSPHVLLFAPLVERLRGRGFEVLLTARDFAQTVPLLEQYGLEAEVIGGHTGSGRGRKTARMLGRTAALVRWARRRRIDLAVSHNSYAQCLAAKLLRIPAATLMDYEHQPASHLSFRLADRVIVPFPFPDSALRRFGASPGRTRRYQGLKEEIYLAEFAPDPSFPAKLAAALDPPVPPDWNLEKDPVAVLRPPARFALYHGFENRLFLDALDRIASAANVRVVFSPRTPAQAAEVLSRGIANLRVLSRGVRGLDLLRAADLVVSAGGTMNREAALLGTPAYSVLAAPLGAVDLWLIEQGRLIFLRERGDLDRIRIEKVGDRDRSAPNPRLADEVLDLILETLPAGRVRA